MTLTRRTFLSRTATLGAATLLFPAALAAAPIPYTLGAAEAAMDDGKIVVLDFWASWCTTCAAQERVLTALKAENPAYEANILFFLVDWDEHANGPLSKGLRIPRRSTLVALKGHVELARIVAGTSRDEIKSLLDTALGAT